MMLMNSIAEVARGRTDDEFGRKLARTAIGKIYRAVDAAISSAVRLVVEPDMFSVIRENAIDRPSELLEFLPTIRTPYPALWIEWSPPPDLKPNWRAGENRTIPEKSGLLIRSKNADGTKFSIVSAWRHARTTQPFATTCPEIASMEAMFDSASKPNSDLEDPKMLRLLEEYRRKYRTHYGTSAGDFELRCERLVGAHFTTYPSPLYATHGFEDPILFSKIIPIGEAALDAARADALNDTRFLMAFLMFLNASNAVERLPRDFAPLNRQRVKSGKMPLYDHQIVRMRLSAAERNTAREQGQSADRRRHLCRGHFKLRKRSDGTTRLAWWRAHMRGAGELTNPIRIVVAPPDKDALEAHMRRMETASPRFR